MISLSNLLKYNYVRSDELSAVVINSNQKSEEILQELLRKQSADEQVPEGFSEGMDAPVIDQESLNRMLEDARREADTILNLAQQKANSVVNDANQRAISIYEEQKQAGYDEGMKQAENRQKQLQKELENAYIQKEQELTDSLRKREENLEKDLIDVITQVFNKVFHIQFDDKKEILLFLVDHTLHHVEKSKSFRIRVSEDTRSYLEQQIDSLREQVGTEAELAFVTDMTMQDSECIIETDSGVFDCSIEVELSNLIKDIKSLCV